MNPVTQKRIRAFFRIRRARWSLYLLSGLYLLSLLSNFIANDRPLVLRCGGHWYAPVLFYYPLSEFVDDGADTRPDYRALQDLPLFADSAENFMIWPPVPWGPNEGIHASDIELPSEVQLVLHSREQVGQVDLLPDGTVARARGLDWTDALTRGDAFFDLLPTLPQGLRDAFTARVNNQPAPEQEWRIDGVQPSWILRMGAYTPRSTPPRSIRILVRRADAILERSETQLTLNGSSVDGLEDFLSARLPEEVAEAQSRIRELFEKDLYSDSLLLADNLVLDMERERVTFPFRPVAGHWMGLDSAGRDVMVRTLYATRTSLSFGFLLVAVTMFSGILIGSLQGYYAGRVDLWGQRLIEIWESLPFLYILMLMGSVFGQSFALLLLCYGLFNWIGISYYMRGEFLRLRGLPFIDAARVSGLSNTRIILRHMLPNSLVPVITFFPFSLVGAIGVLASLDYLGFGLPPPTPSWGELLSQAQEFSFAWWLTLFPALALFIVILLGVFIGEGIREAYDPRRALRWEA